MYSYTGCRLVDRCPHSSACSVDIYTHNLYHQSVNSSRVLAHMFTVLFLLGEHSFIHLTKVHSMYIMYTSLQVCVGSLLEVRTTYYIPLGYIPYTMYIACVVVDNSRHLRPCHHCSSCSVLYAQTVCTHVHCVSIRTDV